jgi:hypothetical protein
VRKPLRERLEGPPASNLQGLLDELKEVGAGGDSVSVAAIRERLGRRAFGSLILVATLPSMTPIATIPALPSVLSVITILVAGQLLLGREKVGLPRAILERAIPRERFLQVVAFLRPVARFIDRLIKPRMTALTGEPFVRAIAALCCFLAVFKIPLEFVPFTGGIPAFPIAVFGLALMTQDGGLVIFGLVATLVALILLALIAMFGVAIVWAIWEWILGRL